MDHKIKKAMLESKHMINIKLFEKALWYEMSLIADSQRGMELL